MKGLLIKDYKLMKNQKGYFIVLFLLCVVFAAREGGESFCVGFITYVCSLFCISTISYDEFDNGNAFLFTLPLRGLSMPLKSTVLACSPEYLPGLWEH